MAVFKPVFEIFKSIKTIPKNVYKALDKRSLLQFPEYCYSSIDITDHFDLKIDQLSRKSVSEGEALVIVHDLETENNSVFPIQFNPYSQLEVFKIIQNENNFEVWLDYENNMKFIGQPERENFYLFSFEKEKAIRFLMNGYFNIKGKEGFIKMYNEINYLLIYKGIRKIIVKNKLVGSSRIPIPFPQNSINLRKLFY